MNYRLVVNQNRTQMCQFCEYFDDVLAGKSQHHRAPITLKLSDGTMEFDEFILRLLIPYCRAYLDNTPGSRKIEIDATKSDLVMMLKHTLHSRFEKILTLDSETAHRLIRVADFLSMTTTCIMNLFNSVPCMIDARTTNHLLDIITEFPIYFTVDDLLGVLHNHYYYRGVSRYCKSHNGKLKGNTLREIVINALSSGFFIESGSKYHYLTNLFSVRQLRKLVDFTHLTSFEPSDIEDAIEKSVTKMKEKIGINLFRDVI